jgi:hypothetical protein
MLMKVYRLAAMTGFHAFRIAMLGRSSDDVHPTHIREQICTEEKIANF